jgi:uncharacterized protein
MKYSIFNSIIPYKDKFALYNSFNQKVIFLEPKLKDILLNYKAEINQLENIHPTFYKYLIDEKFLVSHQLNELEEVKKLSSEIDNNQSNFLLTVNPTLNCNFKCWYCYEEHVKNSRIGKETSDSIKKLINKTAVKVGLKAFTLSFFGGEPLLYFKSEVIPIIDTFVKSCVENEILYSIVFTTNGSLINNQFIKYFKENNISCSLQITLDGHRENHNKVRFDAANNGSYDKIIENIRLLLNNQFPVRLRINYTNENIQESSKIIDDLLRIDNETKEKYLVVDFHRVWQDDKFDDTKDALWDTMKKFSDNDFIVTSKYSPNNVRESCYADKRNSVLINYNGDIYKCTARDFTSDNKIGYLNYEGELIWENNSLEKRMSAKFQNQKCLDCRILPLCSGGCSQHGLENLGKEYCIYFGEENEIDKIVKTKVEELIDAV